MIKLSSPLLAVAFCATFTGMAWALTWEDSNIVLKGDTQIGTTPDAESNPRQGNFVIHGRNAINDPIFRVRNAVQGKNLMLIDRDGLMTLGDGFRPSNDLNVSLLHVKGALAVWPDQPQTWPNSRASASFSRSPDNYLTLTIPGMSTSGLGLRFNSAVLNDENERYKTILGVQKGAIEFKTGIAYGGDWGLASVGALRMKIDSQGRILGGEGLTATPGVASTSQVVLGKYNDTRTNDGGVDHTKGVLVVGAGTGASARQNAIRVTADGTVLVKTSGDISPGEFTSGPTP